MVLGSVWGLGMGTSSCAGGQRVLSRGSNLSLYEYCSLTGLQAKQSCLSILRCSRSLLPPLGLSVFIKLRNIRHHSIGTLFQRYKLRGPWNYCRKELGSHRDSKPPLFYFLPLTCPTFPLWASASPRSSQYLLSEQTAAGFTSAKFIRRKVQIIKNHSP